jgi:hypothetical protein
MGRGWRDSWGFGIGACVLGLFLPALAAAQTCPNVSLSIPTGSAQRYYPGSDVASNIYPTRPQNEDPQYIDEHDCDEDIHLQFTLVASGLPCSDIIQAWAGPTDCTQLAARRASSGSTRCWPVSDPQPIGTSFSIDVRARDIVAFLDSSDPPTVYTPESGANVCQSLAAMCTGEPLSIYFMALEANGTNVDGTPATFDFGVFRGPDAEGGSCDAGDPPDAGPPLADGSAAQDARVAREDGGVVDGDTTNTEPGGGPLLEEGCTCSLPRVSRSHFRGLGLVAGLALIFLRRRRRPGSPITSPSGGA